MFQIWIIDVNFINLMMKMKIDEDSMRIFSKFLHLLAFFSQFRGLPHIFSLEY